MHLLSKNGRTALLTFLRNLTPQALLLSVGLVLYIRWTSTHAIAEIVLAACTLTVVLMAIIANLDEFLDSAFSQSEAIAGQLGAVKKDEPSVAKRIWKVLKFIAREKPITLIEVLIAFFVIYIAMIAVLYTAIHAAARSVG